MEIIEFYEVKIDLLIKQIYEIIFIQIIFKKIYMDNL